METTNGKIYGAMADCMAEVQAIAKTSRNQSQGFNFRGIDAVMNEVHDILAKHRVFILQEIVDAKREIKTTKSGAEMLHQFLTIKYSFTADDGSAVHITVLGEAADSGDKGANKCMAVALKYALTQVFCIPTEDEPGKPKDPDAASHEFTDHRETRAAPVDDERKQGKLYVNSVAIKSGVKNEKPWTLYIVNFSDTREASTFDAAIGKAAEKAAADKVTVTLTTKAGYKPGKLDIVTLAVDEAVQETPAVETQASPDDPPPADQGVWGNVPIPANKRPKGYPEGTRMGNLPERSIRWYLEKWLPGIEARLMGQGEKPTEGEINFAVALKAWRKDHENKPEAQDALDI